MAPALELGDDDLVDVEEAVLLEPDLDKGRLHARENVVDDALVDVAGDRAAFGPLEVDLGDLVVLEHRNTLLADVDGDEELALRGRQRRPARRGSAPLGATATGALGRLALGTALLLLGRVGLGLGRRSRFRLLLAAAAAAATASALRLGLFARRWRVERCWNYWFGLGSALHGRVLLALSAPKQLEQKESPSRARALASPGFGRSARCGYE